MVRIYIRHATPLYSNNRNRDYGYDSPIIEESVLSIRLRARELMLKYGRPEMIVCSPYLRTRQTGAIMLDEVVSTGSILDETEADDIFFFPFRTNTEILDNKRKDRKTISRSMFASCIGKEREQNKYVKFTCDPMLSGYLGNQKSNRPSYKDVTNETAYFEPPLYENERLFRLRCEEHYELHKKYDTPDRNIWFIAHRFFMNRISKKQRTGGVSLLPLDCYIIKGGFGKVSEVSILSTEGETRVERC